jgi:hypothetical protein
LKILEETKEKNQEDSPAPAQLIFEVMTESNPKES